MMAGATLSHWVLLIKALVTDKLKATESGEEVQSCKPMVPFSALH
jgi:hypothetical protein